MSLGGILAIELIALALFVWVLNLVRKGRLYVGYGVVFAVAAAALIVAVAIPPLRTAVSVAVERVFPTSAVAIVGFTLSAFMFVYVLSQLTIISNRVAALVQDLAIRRARKDSSESGPRST